MFSIELSKFQIKKTKFGIKFLTLKWRKCKFLRYPMLSQQNHCKKFWKQYVKPNFFIN